MSYVNEITINGRTYSVDISYVKGFQSKVSIRNGRIELKVSRFLRRIQKENMIKTQLHWAISKIENVKGVEFVVPEFKDGAIIQTHNKIYEIYVHNEERSKTFVKLQNRYIIDIRLNKNLSSEEKEKKIQYLVEKVIIEDQTPYLVEVVQELNSLYFNEDINSIRFKRVKYRFGSCSSNRNINISYRLLFTPKDVFRYVCIHELAHLKEMNHSWDFWNHVESALPDYRIHRKWLKDKGFLV